MNIKFFHSLEGENIYFKAISMDDAQEIHKYASDKEVSRFIVITYKNQQNGVFDAVTE
ncbi:hypothetical protein [Neobacillus massiliamazoniensis]|jgi:ribosomal-protein-alanine N-acetyltransferase|uniref:Uncharacterized protein n=1 Tax=Neobacillus massiliamazoniensis TaxID=1499688 RepID=A0A0U1NZU2_9BACI|nr:hypothetical protein [Neobacillus massiliamazoniensis]CRK83362.1 hypothetical protein BN000_03329 [Neobacillus massiliamazoniensis]